MNEHRGPGPSTAEETERIDRQPGVKGHPHAPGARPDSPDVQPEEKLRPGDRPDRSGPRDQSK